MMAHLRGWVCCSSFVAAIGYSTAVHAEWQDRWSLQKHFGLARKFWLIRVEVYSLCKNCVCKEFPLLLVRDAGFAKMLLKIFCPSPIFLRVWEEGSSRIWFADPWFCTVIRTWFSPFESVLCWIERLCLSSRAWLFLAGFGLMKSGI